jgi:two-component system chemotaxis sensor kinase CheA
MVRDLAKQQSKEVELILEGGDIPVDKHILEKIRDALIHLVRNAIDHGIELPNERSNQGKPSVAKVWISGYQTATSIILEVKDDGRGLDIEKIRQTAIKRKLYSSEELDAMSLNQIHHLIFTSGFSTRSFITEISGRGIGLDVVHTNVNQLKGSLQVESTPSQGCFFQIQISKSLTTIDVFLVEVQGFVYALPIQYVQTSLLISLDEITSIDNQATIFLNDQFITIADLAHLLDLPIATNDTLFKPETLRRDLRPCIILKDGTEQIGLFVDRFLDTQEVVMQPQSQLLERVKYTAGATILGTGEVCIILNPPDLLKSSQKSSASLSFVKPAKPVLSRPVVLLVEDSVPVRTQEKRLLENAGYEVVVAVDGLDGYNKLRTQNFNIVITDVEMPNLDGFSLTAKIRQHREYDDLPIVIVTTLNSDEDRLKGETAGANAYLLKGKFNQDLLLEMLNKLV